MSNCSISDGNGWDDDWDIDVEEDEDEEEKEDDKESPQSSSSFQQQEEEEATREKVIESIEEGLHRYLQELKGCDIAAINENVMVTKDEDALDLYAYYKQRPELADYTIDIEVPRMKYSIIMEEGSAVLTDTQEIQCLLKQHPQSNNMLIRASNQSIMADVFPLLSASGCLWTGPPPKDAVNRETVLLYNMCPIAKSCHFVLDMAANIVHVDACLTIQLPSLPQQPLAELRIATEFLPDLHFPTLSYQLVSITPHYSPNNIPAMTQQLQHEYHCSNNNNNNTPTTTTTTTSSHVRRDDFLHQVWFQSSTLLASKNEVWKDIDAVVNVSSKLQFLKSSLFQPLPPQHEDDDQDQQQQQHPSQQPVERPPSIVMGGIGLLSAGISKLVHTNHTHSFPPPPPPRIATQMEPMKKQVPPPPPPLPPLPVPAKKLPSPPASIVEETNNNNISPPNIMEEEDHKDGWSYDDDDLDLNSQNDDNDDDTMKTSLTMDHAIQVTQQDVVYLEDDEYYNVPKDFEYNPINGILPTRKRFNPQSYRVFGFVKSQ